MERKCAGRRSMEAGVEGAIRSGRRGCLACGRTRSPRSGCAASGSRSILGLMPEIPQSVVVQAREESLVGWTALNRGMRDALVRAGVPLLVRQKSRPVAKLMHGIAKLGLHRRIAS